MARKTTVMLQDDLEGGQATQTIRFGYQGIEYEIDLNDENAKEMTQWLENYVSHGRRVSGRRNSLAKADSGIDAKAIRAWAQERGLRISTRGRIPAEVVAAYSSA